MRRRSLPLTRPRVPTKTNEQHGGVDGETPSATPTRGLVRGGCPWRRPPNEDRPRQEQQDDRAPVQGDARRGWHPGLEAAANWPRPPALRPFQGPPPQL